MIAQLFALLKKLNWETKKEELIWAYTTERTSSVKEMTEQELKSLLAYLQGEIKKQSISVQPNSNEVAQKQRRYIISVWYKIEQANSSEGKQKAVEACKAWVLKMFKGDLNSFSSQELFRIKIAAEKVLKDRLAAIRKGMVNG